MGGEASRFKNASRRASKIVTCGCTTGWCSEESDPDVMTARDSLSSSFELGLSCNPEHGSRTTETDSLFAACCGATKSDEVIKSVESVSPSRVSVESRPNSKVCKAV